MQPSSSNLVNQLVFITVSQRQGEDLMQALVKEHFYFTKIDSSGLVFQEPNICLLIGLNNTRFSSLQGLVKKYCQPYEEFIPVQFNPSTNLPSLSMIEARTGGALLYLLDVEHFEQF